jgi:hypothetical protein
MKDSIKNFGVKSALLALLTVALTAQAQVFTLEDGNSRAQINAGSSAGMFEWLVDGQNQLKQQWFWYRVGGAGGESAINTLGLAGFNLATHPVVTPNQLTLNYTNASFSLDLDYVLTGGSPGSGTATIGEGIRIVNRTADVLSLHLFQYSDFNLMGTPTDTSLALGRNSFNLFNEALQFDGTTFFAETANSPGANHGQVSAYPVLLGLLTDGSPTTLNDAAGPLGAGNLTWALQWDLEIAGNGSVIISKTKYVTVPEPTSAALLALGFGAWALRRRFSR